MTTNHYFKLGLVALTACSLAACMDDRYDLDDVDMTIGTSGDLTLPRSSTGDILLSNILDITEDGIVQAVDGEYFLVEKGDADVPGIDITPISINKPVLSDLAVHVDMDKSIFSPVRTAGVADANLNGANRPDLPNFTYTYTIQPDDKAYYELPNTAIGTVPDDVVSLREVTFVDDTRLDVKVVASFERGHEFISRVHLDYITLRLPRGLHVKSASLSHWVMKDGQEQEELLPAIDIDNESGSIRLTAKDSHTLLGDGHDMHICLTFDKGVTGYEGLAFANHRISLQGKFEIGGTFRIESDEFEFDKFTPEQLGTVIASGSYDAVCPSCIDINGESSFARNIDVAAFSGQVQTTVTDIAPIELNDLPDFLDDPEVVLDLVNPVIYVEVNNPLPAEIRTGLALISKYVDGTPSVRRESGEIVLPANTKCVVRVAETFDGLAMPEKYQGLPVVDAPVADLGGLLTKLPEAIDVEISDITMDIDAMSVPLVGRDRYNVTIDYMIYTPLEFGEGTRLIYQGAEEGLSEDLEDVNKLNTKAIEIAAVAETNFPLDLKLSVDAQDTKGNSLVGSIVTVDDVVINAHKGPENVSYQDIRLVVSPMEGHTMRELLENMDRFVYRAVAEGDGKLLENAYLKLTDIRITLKGGVSYDAN